MFSQPVWCAKPASVVEEGCSLRGRRWMESFEFEGSRRFKKKCPRFPNPEEIALPEKRETSVVSLGDGRFYSREPVSAFPNRRTRRQSQRPDRFVFR